MINKRNASVVKLHHQQRAGSSLLDKSLSAHGAILIITLLVPSRGKITKKFRGTHLLTTEAVWNRGEKCDPDMCHEL